MRHHQRIPLKAPLADVRLRPQAANDRQQTIGPTENELRDLRQNELQAELESIKSVVAGLQETIEEYEQRRQQSLHELQKIAVELGVLAGGHVARTEIERDNVGIERLITDAVEKLQILEAAKVRIHPADHELLNHHLGTKAVPWDGERMSVVADETMERGELRLDTKSGRAVYSNVKLRVDELHESWMELVNVPQNAGRRVSEGDGAMRRFPDRRETA